MCAFFDKGIGNMQTSFASGQPVGKSGSVWQANRTRLILHTLSLLNILHMTIIHKYMSTSHLALNKKNQQEKY